MGIKVEKKLDKNIKCQIIPTCSITLLDNFHFLIHSVIFISSFNLVSFDIPFIHEPYYDL